MRRKFIIIEIFLIVLVYLFGIATGHYKFFPFDIFFKIKNELQIGENSKRNLDTSTLKEVKTSVTEQTGIYLTYGQSNSVNHGQLGYEVTNEVYQFLNGKIYVYKDPALGGTGNGGSVWGMVGDKLIDKGMHDKVIFSNNGWQGKTIEELNSDPYISYFIKSYQELIREYGRVDAILYHQGEINHTIKFGNDNYYKDFKILIQKLKKNGIKVPIYLSRTTICDTKSDSSLIEIQNRIIKDYDIVHKGPNTDLLYEKKYRLPDNCHFSMLGFERFSDMWIESLTN